MFGSAGFKELTFDILGRRRKKLLKVVLALEGEEKQCGYRWKFIEKWRLAKK